MSQNPKYLISLLIIFVTSSIMAKNLKLKMEDGFLLNARFDSVKNSKMIAIIVPTSGSIDMNGDFTNMTIGKKKNLFYQDLSKSLNTAGFSTLRYNKRTYEYILKAQKDPKFLTSKTYKKTLEDNFGTFVDDLIKTTQIIKKKYQKKKIYYIAHGQGTHIALSAMSKIPNFVDGITLISFSGKGLRLNFFEQRISRVKTILKDLDKNGDLKVSLNELKMSPSYKSFVSKFATIDNNSSGKLELNEIEAIEFMSFFTVDKTLRKYTSNESKFYSPYEIIKSFKKKPIIFFHGTLDKVNPSYETLSLKLINEINWKKSNLHFQVLKNVGYLLDFQKNNQETKFNISSEQLRMAVGTLSAKIFQSSK